MQNYFQGCKTLDEAKTLYKKLALKLHPDKGGLTADFQEMLNQFHAFKPESEKFKGEAEQWNSKEYADIINQLLNIEGITIVVCGSWIWLEGDTKPIKEQIKAIDTGETLKRGFSKAKEQWYFSPKGYRKKSKGVLTYDQIKGFYGEEKITKNLKEF